MPVEELVEELVTDVVVEAMLEVTLDVCELVDATELDEVAVPPSPPAPPGPAPPTSPPPADVDVDVELLGPPPTDELGPIEAVLDEVDVAVEWDDVAEELPVALCDVVVPSFPPALAPVPLPPAPPVPLLGAATNSAPQAHKNAEDTNKRNDLWIRIIEEPLYPCIRDRMDLLLSNMRKTLDFRPNQRSGTDVHI
ncbi:MAG: hypothetical protein WA001_03130 [Patescibacteria group bacterium]